MAFEQKPAIVVSDPQDPSFETVLDAAFERLHEMHIRHSIRRIREMELELDRFEKELDDLIGTGHG